MKSNKNNRISHIAIILDGNRRYAKSLGLKPWKGHEVGLNKLEELFKWAIEFKIKEVTLYCFSTENFKRDKQEVRFLFGLFWKEFSKMQNKEGLFSDKVKVNVIGRMNMFSRKMQNAMINAMEKTKDNQKLTVNFALAYGGRQEIIDSINKVIKESSKSKSQIKIDEKSIMDNLYLKTEPDMIIRPGGEIRTSNFLTWQSTYSEWIFLPKLWPEFTKKDFEWCIKEFKSRQRRFGK